MCPEAVGTSSRESGGGRGSGARRSAAGVPEAEAQKWSAGADQRYSSRQAARKAERMRRISS